MRNEGTGRRHVGLFFGPRQVPPSSPLANAMAIHERVMDIATLAVILAETVSGIEGMLRGKEKEEDQGA